MNPKIKSAAALSRIFRKFRARGKKIVFTNGCFDVIHYGHVAYLRKAKVFGDLLVIGLNTDASVRRLKGKSRPVNCERDRAEVLSEFSCVDYVTFFREDTPLNLIRELRPDVIVKGADWKLRDIVGFDFVKAYGGTVKRIHYVAGRSTTGTLKKLACRAGE